MQLFLLTKGGILPWRVHFAATCTIFCRVQLCTADEIFFFLSDVSSCNILDNDIFDFWALSVNCSSFIQTEQLPALSSWAFPLGKKKTNQFYFIFSLVSCSSLLFPSCEMFFQIFRHSCAFKQSTTRWGKKKPKTNSLCFILSLIYL